MVCPVYIESFSGVLYAPDASVTGDTDDAICRTLRQLAGTSADPGRGGTDAWGA